MWLPAISNVRLAGAMAEYVVWRGGPTGTLYRVGMPPTMVNVVATQEGGQTGMMVQIADASLAANPAETMSVRAINPTAAGRFVATPYDGSDPLAGCCFVEEPSEQVDTDTGVTIQIAGFIDCPGGTEQSVLHNRPIPAGTVVISDDGQGGRIANIQTGDAQYTLPVCSMPDKRTPPGGGGTGTQCCYDAASGQLVCNDGSAVAVTFINQIDTQQGAMAIVAMANGTQVTVPLCQTPPGGGDCCFDPDLSILKCDPEDPRDGMSVTMTNSFVDPQGRQVAVVRLADGSVMDAYVCETPPGMCCYDVATGTLRCPNNGGLNGQQVSLVAMAQQPDGSILAIVQIQGQSAIVTYPICDDQVSECCYDGKTHKLQCSDPALDGMDAGVVSSWVDNQGQIWVWAAWPGGGARMPLCPDTKCPPVLCCVNVETQRFVCPGSPQLNGQNAQLADIVTDGGFNWGVLGDGSRVPLCGRDCPPPETCPGCPGCPPGLWMSPDGACEPPPKCPPPGECPPGGKRPCPPYHGGVIAAGDAIVSNPLQEVTHAIRQHGRAANQASQARARVAFRTAQINPTKDCCDDCRKGKACSGCSEPNPRRSSGRSTSARSRLLRGSPR